MDTLSNLINALRYLPGIGPKSAQRIAYHLLQGDKNREKANLLAYHIQNAMQNIHHCLSCNNYTENDYCRICVDNTRDSHLLCVVESPSDVLAIEQSQAYRGHYYVLMGKISPINGIGPDDIALNGLVQRIEQKNVKEIILALSPTVEGQTTIHFIQSLLKPYMLSMTQLAHGIPVGGELEFLDAHTISSALKNRGVLCE